LRSYLFVPGSRPELFARALAAGADAVVFDLEDAVAPSAKAAARRAVADAVTPSACQVHVRVNRGPHGYDTEDVRAVVAPGLAALRLPKAEDSADLARLEDTLAAAKDAAGLAPASVALYPTAESALGIWEAHRVAAASPRVARLTFGAADFLADLRATDDDAALHARGRLVLASRVAGVAAPVDSVHTAVDDVDGLRHAALRARALGFWGKSVLHPRQLDVVHEVFAPTAAELEHARRVVAAFTAAQAEGRAALVVDGEFVDPAVVARARAVLDEEAG
jgi:citrate lyase subunit beta/citryl-CoA lyase